MAEVKLPSADQFDEIIEQMKVANKDKGQDDFSGSPGSKTIIKGDKDAGFYGFVQPSEFGKIDDDDDFNGSNLAKAVGISQGSSQFKNTPWLKFSWRGKVLFTPLKAIRRSISWDKIYEAGAVYGTGSDTSDGEEWMLDHDEAYDKDDDRVKQDSKVEVDGLEYKVRLFKGAGDDPTDSYEDNDRGASGSDNEWNHLILPLHEKAPSSFRNNKYADTPTDDWDVNLTDEILMTHHDYGSGSRSWCQETRDTINSDDDEKDGNKRRVNRGYYGASYLFASGSYSTYSYRGWRPVLELS